MEPLLIDLNDYEYSGEGANGQSFFHKSDPTVMVKLYNASASQLGIEQELEFAQKVYKTGLPTPKPGEFITDGNGRYGIKFERIVGKISISRATGDHPERVEEYARKFAKMCLELHSIHLPKGEFPDIKESNLKILEDIEWIYTKSEADYIRKVIAEAPDGDTAIHGDLQFSNVIMAGDKTYFIDLGDFACGSPLFDLGMVLFTCLYDDEKFLREVFHMEPETAREFWYWFVKEYYGEDADHAAIEMMLRPYAGLKLLIMEKYMKAPLPNYHWLLNPTKW